MNEPCSPSLQSSLSSSSPSCMLLEANYCPQLATLPWDRPASQQVTSLMNRSYLYTLKEGYSEPPNVVFSETKSSFEASDCPLESCGVISPMILYKYWVKSDSVFLPVPYRKYIICLLDILWISYPVFMLNCKLQKWFCLKMILYGCYHNKELVVHKTQIRLSKVWCEKRNKNSGFCSTVKELEMLSTGCKCCNR